jgi:hypothetical protein
MENGALNKVSAVLITKEKVYPEEVLVNIESAGFGEVIILTECEGVFRRFEIITRFPDIYVQDDDCIPDIMQIFSEYRGKIITCGMTDHHIKVYGKSRICLIGHGAFFPAKLIESLEAYRNKFDRDSDYMIETDRIFTFLNFPQNRVETNPEQLPSSFTNDRLSMRKDHYRNLSILEKKLMFFYCFSVNRENPFLRVLRYLVFLYGRIIRR